MTARAEPAVLIPDNWGGVQACDLTMLIAALDEGQSFEDAMINSAFDSTNVGIADLPGLVERIRVLNVTGDATAYWELRETTKEREDHEQS